jgi:hypothetical protein
MLPNRSQEICLEVTKKRACIAVTLDHQVAGLWAKPERQIVCLHLNISSWDGIQRFLAYCSRHLFARTGVTGRRTPVANAKSSQTQRSLPAEFCSIA